MGKLQIQNTMVKPGDKVRIRENAQLNDRKYINKIATVLETNDDKSIRVECEGKVLWLAGPNNNGFDLEYDVISPTDKKIVGYRAPFDMFNGTIKAGHRYQPLASSNPRTYCAMSISGQVPLDSGKTNLPAEIVEQWEPIYEDGYTRGDWVYIFDSGCSIRGITSEMVVQIKEIRNRKDDSLLILAYPSRHPDAAFITTNNASFSNRADCFRKATPEEIQMYSTVTLHLGSNNTEVTVTKQRVTVRGKEVRMSALKALVAKMNESFGKATDEWNIKLMEAKFLIGCVSENNIVTLTEIKEVIGAHEKLQ